MSNLMTFIATGDSFITRRLPSKTDDDFLQLSQIINQGEFRFTNFEVTAHHFEGFPSAVSGGTWAIAHPAVLKDIKAYGFNTMAWANNHTLDYSYGGLEATKKYINKYGFVHAGVGKNLAEASEPKYIDCPSGRVALLSATSTFHESWIAGEQRPDMEGRPGVNPLRYNTNYIVSDTQMKQLKEIATDIEINAEHNLAVKEGFKSQTSEGAFKFGNYNFKVGETNGVYTSPCKTDLNRMLESISNAKRQADYVVVSIHTHEMEGESKDKPPQFLKEFSKACIDAGAHAIIGHGPHVMRGIEIYKNRPIFYSLGNFIFQNETVSKLPHDFYTSYKMGFSHNVADALDKRSCGGKKGLGANLSVWESVIPFWKMNNGELTELKLYPIELGFDLPRYEKGWPKLTEKSSILKDIRRLSEPFGTKIIIEDNIGIIRL